MDAPPLSDPEASTAEGFAQRLQQLVAAIHAVASPNELIAALRGHLLDVFAVEMASIFLVEAAKMQLVSWILLPGNYLRKIRVPVNKTSIVGYCAATRSVVLVNNAYDPEELRRIDPELKFDASWDRKAGSRTRQVLAAPILFQHSLMGVIELINQRSGRDLSEADSRRIADIAETLGIAFRNLQQQSQRVPTRYDMLVKGNLITQRELDRAFAIADQDKQDVEHVLLHNFHIGKEELVKALADYYATPYVDLSAVPVAGQGLFDGLNIDYLRKNRMAPLSFSEGRVVIAAADPHDQASLCEIQQVFGADYAEVRLALPSDIDSFLQRLQASAPLPAQGEVLEQLSPDALTDRIIEDACRRRATDIHIEPNGTEGEAEVRFRISGRLQRAWTLPGRQSESVAVRLKALAGLDAGEERRPRSGKMTYRTAGGREVALRIAAIPTAAGNEDLVVSMASDSRLPPLSEIMPERVFRKFEPLFRLGSGIIVVAGPAGSGRSTTLHAVLNLLNAPGKKIWTAEEQVEITEHGLRQVQVRPGSGLTHSGVLYSILRADPDIIMLDELRDRESAGLLAGAACSGHLVLCSLCSGASAPAAIARLVGMGMDPSLLADALQGILAQRLVRTLCLKCREAYQPDRTEYEHLRSLYGDRCEEDLGVSFSDRLTLYRPMGCEQCGHTGYQGRAGLFELLVKDEALARQLAEGADADQIRRTAMAAGRSTLLQEGIRMVAAGRTDLSEVLRVCRGLKGSNLYP